MVKNPNQYGSLTNQELSDFEKSNNIVLPEGYRAFLLKYNGGQPIKGNIKPPPTIVKCLLGMHNGPFSESLYKHIDMLKDRLPLSCFPIASDPFGNLFIMSVHPENYGQVFFWDHEGEPAKQDGHYIDNVSFVAYSFEEFLNNLD